MAPILVLGLGNLLLSDEGVGLAVIRALAERYDLPDTVEILDGGTAGMDLLDQVAGRARLLVVDCARLDAAPGTVREIDGAAVPAFFQTRFLPHMIGFADLMAGVALMDGLPGEIAFVGIEPESMELGLALSPACAAAVERALALVVARLGSWGAAPRQRRAA
ncbi:MAG: HyaD/HybD family hydrogenase maturation endopeptidase [Roseovarius sp.]